MPYSNLRHLLQKLHIEIDNTETDDDHKQQALNDIKADIQKVIDEPESEHKKTLQRRLQKSESLFEIEHPALAGAIKAVSLSLSSAGM